jgi:hypothetical protein
VRLLLCVLFDFCVSAFAAERLELVKPTTYSGMADASGATAVTTNLFIVADDEDNILRLYSRDHGGPPIKEFDFGPFLEVTGKSLEADLESGARIGDRLFWMGSHGRNKNGKERTNRCRFFATDLHVEGTNVTLTPAGKPYKDLLQDLISDPRLQRFHLAEASNLRPKDAGALNIEGLSATPEKNLLIGFRNPIPGGKALLVPLLNPNEVIQGSRTRLGDPIQLDLDGLGIRDMTFYNGSYLIVAGPYDGRGHFRFYRWKGPNSAPEHLKLKHLGTYHPEALIVYPDLGLTEVQVLSDDGKKDADDGVIEDKLPYAQRTFRSFWIRDEDARR